MTLHRQRQARVRVEGRATNICQCKGGHISHCQQCSSSFSLIQCLYSVSTFCELFVQNNVQFTCLQCMSHLRIYSTDLSGIKYLRTTLANHCCVHEELQLMLLPFCHNLWPSSLLSKIIKLKNAKLDFSLYFE